MSNAVRINWPEIKIGKLLRPAFNHRVQVGFLIIKFPADHHDLPQRISAIFTKNNYIHDLSSFPKIRISKHEILDPQITQISTDFFFKINALNESLMIKPRSLFDIRFLAFNLSAISF